MKNQYIGDINDFYKYALLRALLVPHSSRLQVCWMLTSADGRSDGRRLAYLNQPSRFRALDPQLFDALSALVADGGRSVQALQATGILPRAMFHPAILTDDRAKRALYFDDLSACLGPEDLVFFDPDNGLEVASVPKGGRNSAKYLYLDEFAGALGEGRTLCVYQHFPRCPRAAFVADLLERIGRTAPDHSTFAVATPWVAFVVCTPRTRCAAMSEAAAELAARNGSRLSLVTAEGTTMGPPPAAL